MTPKTRRLTGALVAAASVLAACSSTPVSTGPTTTASTTTTAPGLERPAQTAAAGLRANFTTVFTGYEYLLAVATSTVVTGADPAPALAALQNNTGDLAALLGPFYDAATVAKITQAWSTRTKLFVSYARLALHGQPIDAVKASLAGNDNDVAGALKAADINMPPVADFVASDFGPEVTATTDVIDAQVKRSPDQYGKVVAAANLMPHTADVVAAAIAKQHASQYTGTTTGTAANLRAQLTAALVSHTYVVGILTATVIGGGDPGPAAEAADADSRAISDVFGALYGDTAGKQFHTLWRSQVTLYANYATAGAKSDVAAQTQARSSLDGFVSDLSTLLSATVPKLDKATVAADLQGHVKMVLALIDAQVARSPAQFDLLRTTAQPFTATASAWSEAIVEQFPSRYIA